jgi:hypothetical protein
MRFGRFKHVAERFGEQDDPLVPRLGAAATPRS